MIYKTVEEKSVDDGNFALKQCTDAELVSKLLKSEDWVQGTGDFLEENLIMTYEGKRYYREIESVGTEDDFVSQYPLEDILDEFYIYCYDSYDEENASDKKNSYVEFTSEDIEDIRKVLDIIGKHVYNVTEGENVKLVIE